jgi:hypothetical protein
MSVSGVSKEVVAVLSGQRKRRRTAGALWILMTTRLVVGAMIECLGFRGAHNEMI